MARRRMLELTHVQRQESLDHRDHDPRPDVRERCAAMVTMADGQTHMPWPTPGNHCQRHRDPWLHCPWHDHMRARHVRWRCPDVLERATRQRFTISWC